MILFNKIRITLFVFFILISSILNAQETKEVEAKGFGIQREDALQDSFRAAIGKAIGVSLVSETQVENFMVVQDAITTNTKGYITSYEIINEGKVTEGYEVVIKASVSLSPLKADIQLLTKQIGGVRFLVMYDKRKINDKEIANYEFAVERINGFLAERKYRYIEKSRFEELQKEAFNIMQESDTSTASYVQRLGMMSGAQFIIFVNKIFVNSRSEAFDTRTTSQVTVEAKSYDNCTAEGLGTVILSSDWESATNKNATIRGGIEEAITKNFGKLLYTFNSYIGDWINNGTPYELRFYSVGTFRDFRDLRTKIKADKNFGGQLEIISVSNYTKLNCTFKSLPDDVAYSILDYADEIPAFKEKVLDVKLMYGRQISFAPQNIVIPGLQNK
ncbi:MAG: hypothetical protein KAT68_01435 [Bacteroidales bacterium]|nr:hypothetical protein [Bacteroidales bacterium]